MLECRQCSTRNRLYNQMLLVGEQKKQTRDRENGHFCVTVWRSSDTVVNGLAAAKSRPPCGRNLVTAFPTRGSGIKNHFGLLQTLLRLGVLGRLQYIRAGPGPCQGPAHVEQSFSSSLLPQPSQVFNSNPHFVFFHL